jgi:hypothetical protein
MDIMGVFLGYLGPGWSPESGQPQRLLQVIVWKCPHLIDIGTTKSMRVKTVVDIG